MQVVLIQKRTLFFLSLSDTYLDEVNDILRDLKKK